MSIQADKTVLAAVEEAYSQKAKSGYSPLAKELARSVGYTPGDLESIPATAQLGVGCGSPVTAAGLKEGETVVDFGSGGGIDVLLAASNVGPHGQAIGIDASIDMITLSRMNAKEKGLKPPHVAFIHASLADSLPIASNTVDCVLSNCVINLLPQGSKEDVLKEAYRILKPGGRIVLDDIVAKLPLPDNIRNDLTAYVNCISGSIQVQEYATILEKAGFSEPQFLETGNDLQAICSGVKGSCCRPSESVKPQYDVNAWVASYQITATKSKGAEQPAASSALLRWWDAYPKEQSPTTLISPEELAAKIHGSPAQANRDFAVIDVRRDDHGGGHVRGSDNWPAQSFYDDLPLFLDKYRSTAAVIFYCGSSSGRGPRCAGWYQDYLNETETVTSKAYVLQGGVKAWLAAYRNEAELSDIDKE